MPRTENGNKRSRNATGKQCEAGGGNLGSQWSYQRTWRGDLLLALDENILP